MILAAVFAVIVLAFALAGPVERAFTRSLPLAEIKSQIIAQAKETAGIELSIRGARFEILQGVVLTGVSARFGNDPVFFHGENLIVEISPFKAMKKNLTPQIRIAGGRIVPENLPRARLFELLDVLRKNEGGDWKLDFDGILIDSKPARYTLSGRLTPGDNRVDGRLDVSLKGKRVIKSDFRILKAHLGSSFKVNSLPLSEAASYFPSILAKSAGSVSGKGTLSMDSSSLAYDFHGEMADFESGIVRGKHEARINLNGGHVWKENIGLIASFDMSDPTFSIRMTEKLASQGIAARELEGRIQSLPYFQTGVLNFKIKSRFRALQEVREQIEEITASLENAAYIPAHDVNFQIDAASISLSSDLKFDAKGKALDHAFALHASGPFRFGDSPDLFSGGPLVIEGEVATLDLPRIARAMFGAHSHLKGIGTAEDAEKAEDTGPLWTQRRKTQAQANLLSYFSMNGSIIAKGIAGVTNESVPINISKNGGGISARAGYQKDGFRLEGDYALGFDSDLPHQTIHLKYDNEQNNVSMEYLTGDEQSPRSISLDYNSSMDGLLPADLFFKSTSTMYFRARGVDTRKLDPAPLVFSIAGIKDSKIDELEFQRTTEGGRTMWTQVHASRGEANWTGAGDFSSQEGGKATFFVNAPGGYSRRIDLGVTEAGKWYPREN